METYRFDVVVVGAGIAGASAAAALAADRRVAVLEAEAIAGYHTTGRSAATWIQNYGPPDARVLTRLSRAFLDNPPDGFASTPWFRRVRSCSWRARGRSGSLPKCWRKGKGFARLRWRKRAPWFPLCAPTISWPLRWKSTLSISMSPPFIRDFSAKPARAGPCLRFPAASWAFAEAAGNG